MADCILNGGNTTNAKEPHEKDKQKEKEAVMLSSTIIINVFFREAFS